MCASFLGMKRNSDALDVDSLGLIATEDLFYQLSFYR